ncbi:MAG: hypothetical protein CHACPFDD_02043 [Phycisphaerae bacterium]|nr:hypothetical protein [Phycisphaerae bacterium]
MKRFPRPTIALLAVAAASLFSAAPAAAQGTVIIDRPVRPPWQPNRVTTTPLVLKYQNVVATVTEGVAVTRVEQTFQNPLGTQIEGTYVYPLPDGVAVGDFSMTVGGKTLRGEVLDKDAARRTYEDIVRRARDPGLLEYLNSRLYRASIFPIPPGGLLEVKLEYSQALSESGGLGLFNHPLRVDPGGGPPIERVVVQVRLKSSQPLASVFCPSHKCDIVRPNEFEAVASCEEAFVRPDRDFALYYQRRDAQFGLSVLTHRQAGEPGYFFMRIAPRVDLAADQIQPKDIAFVIDTSGSMAGGKIEQVRRALKYCIDTLNPSDRFNIYNFSTAVTPFRDALLPASDELRGAARDHVAKLQAVGGTNVNGALLEALGANPGDPGRPYLIVFMTDGEPTVDVTNPDQIVQNVTAANKHQVRIHVLGVGSQLNAGLLDRVAEATRGSRDYCSETEDLEIKLGQFVGRLSKPVLTDLALVLAGLNVSDVYPRELPDLFHGGELTVLGRYDGAGRFDVGFSGRLLGQEKRFTYGAEFATITSGNDFLPRLWANRKVAYLLDQIRLHGQNKELVDDVVRLATRYGIVTPYTSALILEDERALAGGPAQQPARRVITETARQRVAGGGRPGRGAPAGEGGRPGRAGAYRLGVGERGGSVGKDAVEASRELRTLKDLGYVGTPADAPATERTSGPGRPSERADDKKESLIRHVADKTFVRDGERWIDSAWDGKQEPRKIKAFSDGYFALLKDKPQLGKFFALGTRVLVVVDGAALEIIDDDGK